jgi:protein gp37
MTTTVIIKSPSPNHKNLLITDDNDRMRCILSEGEELTFNVWSGKEITISEIDKEKS